MANRKKRRSANGWISAKARQPKWNKDGRILVHHPFYGAYFMTQYLYIGGDNRLRHEHGWDVVEWWMPAPKDPTK